MHTLFFYAASNLLQCGAWCIKVSHSHPEATQPDVCNAPFISMPQLPCQDLYVHHALDILGYTWGFLQFLAPRAWWVDSMLARHRQRHTQAPLALLEVRHDFKWKTPAAALLWVHHTQDDQKFHVNRVLQAHLAKVKSNSNWTNATKGLENYVPRAQQNHRHALACHTILQIIVKRVHAIKQANNKITHMSQ